MSASHNSKYYIKKIRKRDALGTQKITTLFIPKSATSTSENLTVTSNESNDEVCSSTRQDECDSNQASEETKLISTDSMPSHSEQTKSAIAGQFTPSTKYLALHPWLQYDFSKKGYTCTVCKVFSKVEGNEEIAFINKGVTWKSTGGHPGRKLKTHEDSARHQNSVQKQISYMNSKVRGSVVQQLAKAANKIDDEKRLKNREYIKKLAKLLYKMAKKHWAVSDNFEEIVRFLAVDLELPAFKDYLASAGPDATYLSASSVNQLLSCISNSIENDTLNAIHEQPCIAIMADETTDSGNLEQFSIFGRFPHNMGMEHYLGMVHVEQTTAKSLMEALSSFLLAKGIDIKKVVFIAFDGCNTMSGVNKGVQRLFRHRSVYALYINCRNHKLALCFKHLFKQYPLLEETDATLVSLSNLFEYSPQKQAVLEKVQEVKGEKILLPIRPSVTRWLSHRDCCVRLVDRYESIIDALDEIYTMKGKDPQVLGVRIALLKPDVVCMVLALCEVLSETNKLSLILQKEDTNFVKLPVYVNSTISCIQEIERKLEDREYEQLHFFSKCDEILDIVKDRAALVRRMRGGDDFDKDSVVTKIIIPLMKSLENEINDAFHCNPVLRAFGVLDPRNFPEDLQDMQEYGQLEIDVLSNHYGKVLKDTYEGHTETGIPFVDGERLKIEFSAFKHQIYALKKSNNEKYSNLRSILFHFEEPGLKQIYPNIYKILQIANVLPTGTASVERGFSHLGIIKTSLRTRLSQETLDNLMRCSLHFLETLPDSQYDEVVDRFKEFGPIRRADL